MKTDEKSHCGLKESLNISPSIVCIFITNAIRIEVMPECPPERFRVLIQGLPDHA